MRFLAALFLIFPLIASAAGGAAYAISPGAGATFDATAGINPVAAPFTFSGTAANDAVIGSKSIPIAANTPYGAASGSVKTAGIFSKSTAAALGKGLAKLAVPVTVGMALYDAYQASQLPIDANGQVMAPPPVGGASNPTCDAMAVSSANPGFCPGLATETHSIISGQCVINLTLTAVGHGCWGNPTGYAWTIQSWVGAPVLPPPTPATDAQKGAAIDAFANSGGGNAGRLMGDAQAAGVPVPDTAVDPAAAPSPMLAKTPWVDTSTQTDAAGNKTTVQKQGQIEAVPTPGQPMSAPIPVKITENVQTINNNTSSVTSTQNNTLVNQAPNVTQAPAVTPANPISDYCNQYPDASICADVKASGLPTEPKPSNTINVSSDLGHFSFSGNASCPADRVLPLGSAGGKSIVYTYKPFCDFLGIFKYGALAVAAFVSGMILLGQKSSDAA